MCSYHPCQSPVIPFLYLLWIHKLHILLLSAPNKHIPNIPILILTKLNPKQLPSEIECPIFLIPAINPQTVLTPVNIFYDSHSYTIYKPITLTIYYPVHFYKWERAKPFSVPLPLIFWHFSLIT